MGKGHSLQPPSPSDPRGAEGQSGAGMKPWGGAQPRWEGQGARYLQLPPLIGFKCGTADGGGIRGSWVLWSLVWELCRG